MVTCWCSVSPPTLAMSIAQYGISIMVVNGGCVASKYEGYAYDLIVWLTIVTNCSWACFDST